MASPPGAAGPGAGFPQWTYNTLSHQVAEVPNAFAKTMAIAATWPDKLIFFTSEASADAYMASQGGGHDTSHTALQTGANDVSKTGQAAVDATVSVPQFLAKLSSANTWLRVAEVLVGAILLAVALNKLLGNPAGTVAKAAVKV